MVFRVGYVIHRDDLTPDVLLELPQPQLIHHLRGRYVIRTPSINDHLCTVQFGHRFGIQPSVSSSFLLALAHIATQSNDSETVSSPKLQNPRNVSDFRLPLELPGL